MKLCQAQVQMRLRLRFTDAPWFNLDLTLVVVSTFTGGGGWVVGGLESNAILNSRSDKSEVTV